MLGPRDTATTVWGDVGVGCNMSLLRQDGARWWQLRCGMVDRDGGALPLDPEWDGLRCAPGYEGPQLVAAVAKVGCLFVCCVMQDDLLVGYARVPVVTESVSGASGASWSDAVLLWPCWAVFRVCVRHQSIFAALPFQLAPTNPLSISTKRPVPCSPCPGTWHCFAYYCLTTQYAGHLHCEGRRGGGPRGGAVWYAHQHLPITGLAVRTHQENGLTCCYIVMLSASLVSMAM